MIRPKTKILVDGGDPQETQRRQTTNPSLTAKNPHIKELFASGHKLSNLETELATLPAKILEQWASRNFPTPDNQFRYKAPGKPTPYEELDLEQGWETFDIQHELTRKGIEKFAADYRATLVRPA